MKNTLTFLGTGTSQGVPVISCSCDVCNSKEKLDKRFRSSVLINLAKKNILIDSGPDLRLQLLREKVDKIDSVLFTHEHRDHVAGIDDLRSLYYSNKNEIPLYMTNQVHDALKRDYSYLFSDLSYFGKPKFSVNIIENKEFRLFGNKIQPIQVMHYKLPVLGYKILDLVYITDANYISEIEQEKIKGIKTLIINCLQIEQHISHFNLKECLDLISFVKPKKAYLTHISHNLGLHNVIQAKLPKNVFLAYDGLKINF